MHYRHAWGRSPLGNLQAARTSDIPFATQRSDDWPLENTPLGVLGEEVPPKLDRGQRRNIVEALRKQDHERRLHEAQSLVNESGQK
jgi:sialate O-acetylesterase